MNYEEMQEMLNRQFNDGQQQAYLKATSLEHCAQYIKYDYNLSVLPNANVLAVLQVGAVMLFEIDRNGSNQSSPNREVQCYSFGNGVKTKRDIVEVFNLIQKQAVCWCFKDSYV